MVEDTRNAPGALNGRVVTVTGAGQGIGRASSLRLAEAGASVVVADIDPVNGAATVDAVRAAGGQAAFIRADVTVESDVEAMVSFAVERFGRLDGAHNNAGGRGAESAVLHEIEEADWTELVDLNLKGTWLCMKHQLRHMLAHGGGSIVNTGSAASYRGSLSGSWYVGAKHGVAGLSRWAAFHYAARGVRVNVVCPGVTRTELVVDRYGEDGADQLAAQLNPIGRIIEAREIAEAALWLLGDTSSAVTGAILPVDGGQSAI